MLFDLSLRSVWLEASKGREEAPLVRVFKEPRVGVSKWDIRHKIWDYMEANNLADFPRPVHHRIPNFKARKTLLVPTPRLRTGLFNRIVPPPGATKEILRKCATSQVGIRNEGGGGGITSVAQLLATFWPSESRLACCWPPDGDS
uniref:Uncharacterized protein n=1 Tax=Varanus komodoensis TaxID=61221 RepID=A0A8D2Q5T6_VARKO